MSLVQGVKAGKRTKKKETHAHSLTHTLHAHTMTQRTAHALEQIKMTVKINNARVHGDREGRKERGERIEATTNKRQGKEREKRKGVGKEKSTQRQTNKHCLFDRMQDALWLPWSSPSSRTLLFLFFLCAFFFFSVKYKGDGEQREERKRDTDKETERKEEKRTRWEERFACC